MTVQWWKAAGIRAAKTFCQTAASLIGTGAVGFTDLDWIQIASVSGVAALVSILTSVAGLPELDEKTGAPIGDEAPTKTTEDTQAVAAEKAVAAEEDKEAEDAAAEKRAE